MKDIKVMFPLKGIWQVVASPEGLDFSQDTHESNASHAFDFAKTEDLNRSLFDQLKVSDTQRRVGWRQDVLSPCTGKIVRMVSTQKDKLELHFFKDLISGLKASIFKQSKSDQPAVLGNYLIIETDSYFCLLANLKQGSIKFEVGDEVEIGQKMAEVGHSGRFKVPHLHLRILDSVDLNVAKDLPVYFDLRSEVNRQWNTIEYCLPTKGARIQGIPKK